MEAEDPKHYMNGIGLTSVNTNTPYRYQIYPCMCVLYVPVYVCLS